MRAVEGEQQTASLNKTLPSYTIIYDEVCILTDSFYLQISGQAMDDVGPQFRQCLCVVK